MDNSLTSKNQGTVSSNVEKKCKECAPEPVWLAEQFIALVSEEKSRTQFLDSKLASTISMLSVTFAILLGIGSWGVPKLSFGHVSQDNWRQLLITVPGVFALFAFGFAMVFALLGAMAKSWYAFNLDNFKKEGLSGRQYFGMLVKHCEKILGKNRAQNEHKAKLLKKSQKCLLVAAFLLIFSIYHAVVKLAFEGRWFFFA